MIFLILCCFLLPSLCGGCFCSGVSSGTASVDFVLDDDSKTMLFLLSSVCSDCVCCGDSSGTSGVNCVLVDVSNTMLFSVA